MSASVESAENVSNLHRAASGFRPCAQRGQTAAFNNRGCGPAAVVQIANVPCGRGLLADNLKACPARMATRDSSGIRGLAYHKLRVFRVLCGNYAAALDGHANRLRGAAELFKCVRRLFIGRSPQQKPNVSAATRRGRSPHRPARRKETAGFCSSARPMLVVDAGFGVQNLLFCVASCMSCPYRRSRRFMAFRRRLSFFIAHGEAALPR